MNKIIIDPHYCSKEEYQELKDYLNDKTWDWQEIPPDSNDKFPDEELKCDATESDIY